MTTAKRLRLIYLQQSAARVADLINSDASTEEINSAINILRYDVNELERSEMPCHQREAGALPSLVALVLFIGTCAVGLAVLS